MRSVLFLVCCVAFYFPLAAQQGKSTVSSLGARYVADSTGDVLVGSLSTALEVSMHIEGIGFATSISIGVGNTPLASDGITTIFEVIKDSKSFYLVEQNQRFPVNAGMVKVLVAASSKREDYIGHYIIVQVTDKEGKMSAPVSIEIQ